LFLRTRSGFSRDTGPPPGGYAGGQPKRLSELQVELGAGLADLNTLLTEHLETLLSAQAEQIADLRHALETHTHDYYAPKGKPRRRVLEQTEAAEFPLE
jgi:hypothetical protein